MISVCSGCGDSSGRLYFLTANIANGKADVPVLVRVHEIDGSGWTSWESLNSNSCNELEQGNIDYYYYFDSIEYINGIEIDNPYTDGWAIDTIYYRMGDNTIVTIDTFCSSIGNCGESQVGTCSDGSAKYDYFWVDNGACKTIQINMEEPATNFADKSLFSTVEPTVNPSENPTLTPSADPTVNPTFSPSQNPSLNPTSAPSWTNCQENGLISHIDWNNLDNTLPTPDFSLDTYTTGINGTNPGLIINLDLDYIGYSYDSNGGKVGTSYVFDFEQFDTSKDKLNKPGSCSNRLVSNYDNASFNDYWSYSEYPSKLGNLGNNNFLAYGELPSFWTLSSLDLCTKIRYYGVFTWDDLVSCKDFYNNSLISINTNNEWINLTGRFYLSVISPYNNLADIGVYYRKNLITSYPFEISIKKTVSILGSLGINVFLLTVFESERIVNNSLNNGNGGYKIIISTITSDYLKLDNNPALLTHPNEYNTWEIDQLFNEGEESQCYININNLCIQFWSITVDNLECPVSFSGTFTYEWKYLCNDDGEIEDCNSFINNYGDSATLSYDITYADTFSCSESNSSIVSYESSISFHNDNNFSVTEENPIYRSGVDTIYIEIKIDDLVSTLTANVLNVWICAPQSSDIELSISSGSETTSGCFDSQNIDSNYFYTIIVNGDALLFNATIYNTSSHNSVRYSFITPPFEDISTLYVQTEIELSFNGNSASRRLLLSGNNIYEIMHVINTMNIESSDFTGETKGKKNNSVFDGIWFYIVIAVVSLICIIGAIVTVFKVKNGKKKLEQRVESNLYKSHKNTTIPSVVPVDSQSPNPEGFGALATVSDIITIDSFKE